MVQPSLRTREEVGIEPKTTNRERDCRRYLAGKATGKSELRDMDGHVDIPEIVFGSQMANVLHLPLRIETVDFCTGTTGSAGKLKPLSCFLLTWAVPAGVVSPACRALLREVTRALVED